jgi:hypothetical protein
MIFEININIYASYRLIMVIGSYWERGNQNEIDLTVTLNPVLNPTKKSANNYEYILFADIIFLFDRIRKQL